MKKITILLLLFLVVSIFLYIAVFSIYHHFSTLSPKETNGTIICEVVYVKCLKADLYDTCKIYVKPTPNDNNAPLMCLTVNTETSTESNHIGAITEIPEIQIGTIIEIEYVTQNKQSLPPLAKSIKYSNKQTDLTSWTALTIRDDDYSPYNSKPRSEDFGRVVYVSRIISPRCGYLVYLDNAKYGTAAELSCYWIDDTIKDKDSELFDLLIQRDTGFMICITPLAALPFNEVSAFPALFAFLISE